MLDIERLMERVSPEPNTGCWLWFGANEVAGYGVISVNRKHKKAHRVFYELLVGQVPDGLCLDHLCRERSCVNPQHLEPVTIQENIARGIVGQCTREHSAKITQCVNGHNYDTRNTLYVTQYHKGIAYRCRRCRECKRILRAKMKAW